MLRPERMSKISVTGSKAVMSDVVETVHDLNRLHLTDYDGSWEGFENGDPVGGADAASEKLVTVRGLESTLGLEDDDVDPAYEFDPDELEERLESVRSDVNDLDDRRQELRQELREVEDRIDSMEPFARLGIDLDLLSGYENLEVVVGEGEEAAVRAAYEGAEEVRAVETFSGDGVVAAAVAPAEGVDPEDAASDPLVGVEFTQIEVPDAEGQPESYVEEQRHEAERLESELETIESEIEQQKLDVAGFLLAAEEYLSIRVQKGEAPLQFATTENSFVAEGWLPENEVELFESSLRDAVGDRIEFEQLETAAYTEGAHEGHDEDETEHVGETPASEDEDVSPAQEEQESPEPAVTDGGERSEGPRTSPDERSESGGSEASAASRASSEPCSDGGVVTVDDEPPVIQRNPTIMNPFEVLVTAVNRPKYSEFDPTMLLFLTFPLFFGFMIGDIGYGLIYVGLGYWTYKAFADRSQGISDFGGVVAWMGGFTILFGFLYGELFGLHLDAYFPAIESVARLEKGISGETWAIGWLLAATIMGWLHLNIGWGMEFVEEYQLHDAKAAILEVGSWLLMLNGLWIWIFSSHMKNETLQGILFDPIPLSGFNGLPAELGIAGLAAYGLGMVLLAIGPTYELAEFLQPLVHALSYTRLTAVLLSKAGMALAVNLLYFGAYQDEKGYHFMTAWPPGSYDLHGKEPIFDGLYNMGIEGVILGIPVLIVGHIVVLAIGGTAALQAVRLEYVEFFGKFYEGGGKTYNPFGHERTYTSDSD